MNNSSPQTSLPFHKKSPEEQTPFIAFMAHILHKHLKQVEQDILKNYNVQQYLITAESSITVGEHLHYYVEFSDKDYNRYRDNILKNKYKLVGRTDQSDKNQKQYGKISKVKSKERYLSYILKDKGSKVTNIPQIILNKIPPWTEPKIPGYAYKDYILQKDRTNFETEITKFTDRIHLTKKLKNESYRITTTDIAMLWLNKMDKALPPFHSLLYMCYKAKILSDEQYICIKYRDEHTLVTKSNYENYTHLYDNNTYDYTAQFNYPKIH